MITLANIRRAIYNICKRLDILEKNGGSGGASSSEVMELQNKVTALESIISEGENPTAAIDKFNEIVAFLNSIQNTDTLSGLLQDIISQIPDAQIQSDWNQSDSTAKDFIKNKPTVVSDVAYDTTNKKITKTINGTTSDVVTSEKVVEDGGGMNLVEGYYYNKKFYKEAAHTTEITGKGGRIYIDKDTNREYRFDGTKYVLLKSEVDGSFVNEGTFAYRPTAGALDVESGAVGEGGAQIECVKGNTIAWNQLNSNLNEVTLDGEITSKIVNISRLPVPALDHKYYLSGYVYKSSDFAETGSGTHRIGIVLSTPTSPYGGWAFANDVAVSVWTKVSTVVPSYNATNQYISLCSNYTITAGSVSCKNVQVIDLTLIYGEGNEPTTPEQFEADYQKWFGKPLTYEEYDEGSLRSVEMTGIKTVGFNLYTPDMLVLENDSEITKNNDGSLTIAARGYQENYNYFDIPFKDTPYCFSMDYVFLNKSNEGASFKLYVNYTDGTKELVFIEGNVGEVKHFSISTNPAKVIQNVSFGGWAYAGSAKISNICINLSHSGDRNGDYEPYWEHTASLPVTQLKGKLNGEGESVVIFPDGMKKAGTVYDEIVKRGNQTVAIKRIGAVDLGNLIYAVYGNTFYVELTDKKITTPPPFDIMCSKYAISNKYAWDENADDKAIACSSGTRYIFITDSAYSDAATFKTAMQGVLLYYELATPQEYIIDDIDFPTEYPVDDYGTEEILSDSAKSLAPTLDIRYGLNATDTLRNLPSKYVSAVEEQNFTEAQKERARVNIGAASLSDVTGMFASLPTSDPQVAGSLWNDGGVVKISVGTSNN